MAGAFTSIDLSKLPAPDVIEALDYESILAELLQDYRARMEAVGQPFTALVESDPAYKLLETCAYRSMLDRQRVNEAARAVMLAYARGADLDHIAANYNVARLVVTPEDATTLPPTPAVMESDEAFRARIPLSLEGYTTAGSEGSYVYHGMSADGDVKDVAATSPTPGMVTVYVLSHSGDGSASEQLLERVTASVNAEYVRPMTDNVTVLSASIVPYTVSATLTVYPGPSADTVLTAAREALEAYASATHRIGHDVTISGIHQALHQPGVQNVTLATPAANISVSDGQAAYCSSIDLSIGGTDV